MAKAEYIQPPELQPTWRFSRALVERLKGQQIRVKKSENLQFGNTLVLIL